ncbi:helix-turn-helix domain-containing protein [Nocardiopsis alborubida]|uniref:Helix-turn-helix domain-containing protein n=1 Tax=Nocardiopsis alborubida TaxID=146802 RepID=A0A7X6RS53_9ACTN|nr:helix-turn-helix transcriptional regulator [Nocardiopsis alborubida]NKY99941.1 helix-turn-helix domain-containing protein [Nocardiopsis alborubida]
MQSPISPSVRRRRLARELRRLREAHGLKLAAAAKDSRVPLSTISSIENATARRIRARDIDALADLYNASEEMREALHELTRESKESGWWSRYRDVFEGNALPDFEAEASLIRRFEGLIIPGLLQTPAYSAAVFRAGRVLEESEVGRRVQARMERKNIFNRVKPPHMIAVIDEGALQRAIGGHEVMREQLEHLRNMALRHHIDIQILPYQAGAHLALAVPFTILDFPAAKDPSIVYLETVTDDLYLDKPEEVEAYSLAFSNVQGVALSTTLSFELIEDVLESLESAR